MRRTFLVCKKGREKCMNRNKDYSIAVQVLFIQDQEQFQVEDQVSGHTRHRLLGPIRVLKIAFDIMDSGEYN